jgi:hypothetical protein
VADFLFSAFIIYLWANAAAADPRPCESFGGRGFSVVF